MNSGIPRWLRETCIRPFGYFRLAGALSVLVLFPVFIAYAVSFDPAGLHAENGPIESLSVVCWAIAILLCVAALFRSRDRIDRMVFRWFSFVCGLAVVKELDAHVLLNPKYFGPYGVHYRIDWFISNKFHVSIILKLIWGAVFLGLLAFLVLPLILLRKQIMRLIRNGDVAVGLFLLGIISLMIGFVFDDILRHAHFMSLTLRQAIEENAEMLGALLWLTGICCLFWKRPSERLGSEELLHHAGSPRKSP